MIPAWLTTRRLFLLLFLGCAGLMAFGYYLQYSVGLEPCPLCMTQRVFIVAVGLTALLAAMHGPRGVRGVRGYAAVTLLFSLVGGGFATRHVWLQHLPAGQAPACGPPLEYLFEALPFLEALKTLLRGDGNCAVVDWRLLGFSIPEWTLLAFASMAILMTWTLLSPRPR